MGQGLISDGGVLLPDAADAPFYDSSGRVRRKLTDAVIAEIEKATNKKYSGGFGHGYRRHF